MFASAEDYKFQFADNSKTTATLLLARTSSAKAYLLLTQDRRPEKAAHQPATSAREIALIHLLLLAVTAVEESARKH